MIIVGKVAYGLWCLVTIFLTKLSMERRTLDISSEAAASLFMTTK